MAKKKDAWQPRETAPKDGRHFMAWGPNDGLLFTMHWHEDRFRTRDESWKGPFTHWMPLPAPPKP